MMSPVRLLGSRFEVVNFYEHYDIEIDVSYDALGVVPGVSTDKHYCCKLMM